MEESMERWIARTRVDPPCAFEGVYGDVGEGGYAGDAACRTGVEEEDVGMAQLGDNVGV